MKPRNKSIVADSLLDTQALLTSILESDELSEWSRAGVFGAKKKVRVALDNIIPTEEDFIYSTCGIDPKTFIENFILINTPSNVSHYLKLNPLQSEVLNGFNKNKTCRVKVPRQCGLTTLACAYALWSALFIKNSNIVFITLNHQMGSNTISTIRSMYYNLPEFLKMEITDCRNCLKFENGSQIRYVSSTEKRASNSTTITKLFFSDYQFYNSLDFRNLYLCAYPTVASNGNVYFYSTTNKHFQGTIPACDWVGSFDYSYDPSHDAKWVIKTIRDIGFENFEREYM